MSKLSEAIKKIANMNPEFVDFEPKEESNKGLEFLNMAEEILNDDHDEDCDYCATPEQEAEVNQFWEEKFAQDYMPKLKQAPTSEMQPMQMPELKSKPSHLEFPVMPKSKSKKEILDEVQSLLQELEDIESEE
jgi:hypothetical protein